MKKSLRPYQQLAIDRVSDAIQVGRRRGIINLATGLGKSFTTTQMTKQLFPPEKNRTMFFAPARSLVTQMVNNYRTDFPETRLTYHVGNTHYPGLGMIMGRANDVSARIMVSSVQSVVDKVDLDEERNNTPIEKSDIVVDRFGNIRLKQGSSRRVLVSDRFDQTLQHGGLPQSYVFDEAHHSVAEETLRMFKRIQEMHELIDVEPPNIIGLTATPMRWDGVALANLYDTIYIQRGFRWAQRNGYLVPFADPLQVNLVVNDSDTDKNVNIARNWADLVVDTFLDETPDRQVIVFTSPIGDSTGVQVARDLSQAFRDRNVPAAQVDGMSSIDYAGNSQGVMGRGEIFNSFSRRETNVLCMYGVGLEGLDLPIADCLFWMRRTDNVVLMTQAVGRILRLHPGKTDALLVDFTGKGLSVSPMGTLMGMMVDPDQESPEELETEDLLEDAPDGMSLLDATKDDKLIEADGTVVTVGRIINRQGHDWYHDAETDSMSLAVNTKQMLIIKYPNYTLRQKADTYLRILLEDDMEFTKGSEFWRVQQNLARFTQEEFNQWVELLEWVQQFAGNYTLWHVRPSFENTQIVGNGFVQADHSLDTLMTSASRYSYSEIESHDDFLNNRKKTWSGKATGKQRSLLQQLGHSEWNAPDLKKKEASKMVSHTLGFRALIQFEARIQELFTGVEK